MKKISLLAVVALLALLTACDKVAPIDLENYKPIKEFKPATEAIVQAENSNAPYDLEKTVCVMNALEAAQMQSDDFHSYLEYMARQDYEGVAPEVLRAKAKLLPIMQHMFLLQKQHKDMDEMWMLMRSISTGASTAAQEMTWTEIVQTIAMGGMPPLTLFVQDDGQVDAARLSGFEAYEKQKNLKGELEDEIAKIKEAYIAYLAEYAPVYHKYMKEWDAVCIEKDKAYIDVYSGRTADGLRDAEGILQKYPNNREALLLKGMALVMIGMEKGAGQQAQFETPALNLTPDTASTPQASGRPTNGYFENATATLDHYESLYPDRTAPALIIRARMEMARGNVSQGMAYLDQASMEYPRQAEKLTDLMDSYQNRSYLNKTPEGLYLLSLYRSTMEGYGLFSPNLQKANYYYLQGDIERSSTEIYNHFFRRGNQGVYDCLLSDMEFCENNLKPCFSKLLIEHSYMDVNISPTRTWYFAKKDNEINVELENRTDYDLENVRVFLCLHYTDMYTNQYDVVKTASVSKVPKHDTTDLGDVELNFGDKTFDDITRYRAIVMTDDKICWVDSKEYKLQTATQTLADSKTGKGQKKLEQKLNELQASGLSQAKVMELLGSVKVYGGPGNKEKSWWDNFTSSSDTEKLRVEVPRILTMLEPVFCINELNGAGAVHPEENIITGTNIYLKFDFVPEKGSIHQLYMYSEYGNARITINFATGSPKVTKVEKV